MKRAVVCLLTVLTGCVAGSALTLTGVGVYSTNGSGNPSGGQFWNTLGGDGLYNVYLRQSGVWINSGNTNPSARVSIAMTPGVHTFEIYGQPGSTDHFGLSLMFDGDDSNVRIAAHNASSGGPTGFSVTSSGDVSDLNWVSGATPNSLSYSSGGTTATLTKFVYETPAMSPVGDTVQAFNNVSGGGNDYHGVFELTVPVPEPFTLGLACLGLVAGIRRRRKAA